MSEMTEINSTEEQIRLKEAIEINASEGGSAKQKISPVGSVIGFDGREYLINGAALVTAAVKRGIKIPLLIEHGFGADGGKAAGWIDPSSLEAGEDGLYAAIEKNNLGGELIGSKSYLYYSPSYRCDRVENTLIVRELAEVSLTNTPNLAMPEANAKEDNEELNAAKEKLRALETENETLKETAAELNAAIEAAKKQFEKLAMLEAENRALKVDLAIERGRIWPKDREFALSLADDQLNAYIGRSSAKDEAGKLGRKAEPAENGDQRGRRFVRLAINPNNKGGSK
jgi:hypothetical protein